MANILTSMNALYDTLTSKQAEFMALDPSKTLC